MLADSGMYILCLFVGCQRNPAVDLFHFSMARLGIFLRMVCGWFCVTTSVCMGRGRFVLSRGVPHSFELGWARLLSQSNEITNGFAGHKCTFRIHLVPLCSRGWFEEANLAAADGFFN